MEPIEQAEEIIGHHAQETRDLAYQLWAFVCGRDVKKVAAELSRTRREPNPDYNPPAGLDAEELLEYQTLTPQWIEVAEHPNQWGEPTVVPERTLRDWVRRYAWPERVGKDLAALAPAIHQEQIAELILLSVDARRWMRSVYQQAQTAPHSIEPTYGRALGPLMNGAMGALDRAGYSHLGRIEERVHQIDDPTIRELLAGVEAMSEEELIAADAALVDADLRRQEERITKR